MKKTIRKNPFKDTPEPSFLVLPYIGLILKISYETGIDPAMIATIVEMDSKGQKLFREFVSFNWSFYFAGSVVWQKRMQQEGLTPEDIASTYGLWALPFSVVYSYGLPFTMDDLYNENEMIPYLCRYITDLLIKHKFNVYWALTNYHYLGTINNKTIKKYRVKFLQRFNTIRERYLNWKYWMMIRGCWNETIFPEGLWLDVKFSASNTKPQRNIRSLQRQCS